MNLPPLALALERSAVASPDSRALRGEGTELTYGQLLSRARALAQRLQQQGTAKNDVVMVKASNHPLDFVALLAVWMVGCVAVPVHRTSPSGVVEGIQSKAQCNYCVDLLQGDDGSLGVSKLQTSQIADLGRPALLHDAALVIFTSGSTGLPKGVVLTHKAFAGKLEQNQRFLAMRPDDVCLLVLNNTFSFGLWMALLTLNHGGTVVTRSRFDPLLFVDTLLAEGVTRTGVVPTMIRAIFSSFNDDQISDMEQQLRAQTRLRDVVIGGEPLGSELSAKLRSFIAPAKLHDVYGLTETSTSDFVLTPQAYCSHPDSIGQSASGVTYRVCGDDGEECPVGVAGELQLRTPYIMAGYLGDEELTCAAFTDGWFRTGDLVTRDVDGFVKIVGRLKELIVRGGNKITPLEVEYALIACPGVASALVVGMPDPVLGQRIHALLIPRDGAVIDAAVIRARLATTLERFKHPDICYVGTELPTGRTGKIDRSQLQTMLSSGTVSILPAWTS